MLFEEFVESSGLKNLNTENELLNCDVNQRTLIWTRKKANKTESLKQQLYDKEFEECNFTPCLVSLLFV